MRLRLGWLTPLLLLGCLDAFAPAGAVPFTPPAVYRAWWTEIERCAGLSGDFDRVEWYEVPVRRMVALAAHDLHGAGSVVRPSARRARDAARSVAAGGPPARVSGVRRVND